jgi:hypothetical protein
MNYKGVKDRQFKCINCNKEILFKGYSNYKHKYCNNKCQQEYQYKNITLPRFNKGEIKERPLLRKILSYVNGYKCVCCGVSEWNKKPLILQVNHIDGNCTNNIPVNLELICPNCHSQTNTFGGRNKGKGRKARGLPLHY